MDDKISQFNQYSNFDKYNHQFKNLGFGLGLRFPHYQYIMENKPNIDWFEIISENYLCAHQGYIDYLVDLRKDYQIVMHGVSLSIGSTDPINLSYLAKLKNLSKKIDAAWISDHLCFTGINGYNSHDLLPIPYTKEALNYLIPRINQVQDFMQQAFVFENASTYLEFASSDICEAEFINQLCQSTGCKILLDINNVYVNSYNHGFSAFDYIDQINEKNIVQYHLAGHSNQETHIIDTHDAMVADAVWQIFAYAIAKKGFRPTMIEWDDKIPEFNLLLDELNKARELVMNKVESV